MGDYYLVDTMIQRKNEHVTNRLRRAVMLCDLIIEDLNCADLDIEIHRVLNELHGLVLKRHKELMATEPSSTETSYR